MIFLPYIITCSQFSSFRFSTDVASPLNACWMYSEYMLKVWWVYSESMLKFCWMYTKYMLKTYAECILNLCWNVCWMYTKSICVTDYSKPVNSIPALFAFLDLRDCNRHWTLPANTRASLLWFLSGCGRSGCGRHFSIKTSCQCFTSIMCFLSYKCTHNVKNVIMN